MRFLLAILLCVSPSFGQGGLFRSLNIVAASGGSTITVPQSCVGHGTDSNTAVCTFSSATTAGSAIACSISDFDTTSASATVNDNNSNSFAFDVNSGAASDANNGWWITYGIAGRSGHAVTVTLTGKSPSLACFEITHVMSPVDQHDGVYPGSSTAATVPAVTPSQNNEIVLSSIAHLGGSGWTASGFANYQEYVYVMGESFGITAGYVIQGTAAARNAAWVAGSGFSSTGLAARTITLKENTGTPSLITLLQTNICTSHTSASACTITSTTAGSALLIPVLMAPGSTATGITTSAGDTVTQVASCYGTSSGATAYDVWKVPLATAGTTTITVTTSAGNYQAGAYEVSGLSGALDAACAVVNNQMSSTTPSGASVTTTFQPDFMVAVLGTAGTCTGIHSGNVFTNDSTIGGNCMAHYITSSTGAKQPQWDQSAGAFGGSTVAFSARLAWTSLTNGQWTSMSNGQWTALTN